MASKLGVTALYVTPTQESGGPLTPRTPPGSPPLVVSYHLYVFAIDVQTVLQLRSALSAMLERP